MSDLQTILMAKDRLETAIEGDGPSCVHCIKLAISYLDEVIGAGPSPELSAGGDAQAPPEYPDAPLVCAELYQVIGYMAFHYGIMEHPDVQKALDNASQHKLVHADLLPWPKQDLPAPQPPQD